MEIWVIVLIVVAVEAFLSAILAIGNFSYDRFLAMYNKMFQTPAQAHKTIIEYINEQNYSHFDGKLKVARTKKIAGDGYSHKNKVLILTDKTLSSNSAGAFAIVAHELGHAEQDFASKKFVLLGVFHKIGWVLGKLFLPAIIAAIVCGSVAAAIFVFAVVVKCVTISLEKDASKRAIKNLNKFLPNSVMKDVKKFLNSARLTYWSDLVRLLFGWSGLVRKTKMIK